MEELLLELNRRGIRCRVENGRIEVKAPKGAMTQQLAQALADHRVQLMALLAGQTSSATSPGPIECDQAARYDPFPLTEMQHAYWVGRDGALEMGAVATHLYLEFDCEGLDVARLEEALCQLIERHDMLRMVVGRDGMQRTLASVPRYRIAVQDASGAPGEAAEQAVHATRELLSHQVLAPDTWPLFDIRVTRMPHGRSRLHVSLDLLALDAWSIMLLFREWHARYAGQEIEEPAPRILFRDYALALRAMQASPAGEAARAYWAARLPALPPAPELPLRSDPAARRRPRFARREFRLPAQRWQPLKQLAREQRLTPSALLLAGYAEVLCRWSAKPHFTLNLTLSNRRALHPDIAHVIGDFTSSVLLEVDRRDPSLSFLSFARRLHEQFMRDMQHADCSGVTVMRDWARQHGMGLHAVMPVVFTSGLVWNGKDEVADLEQFGRKVHSAGQTSQVWLDHSAMELRGDLVLIWDAAEAVFEEGTLDAMFSSYVRLLVQLEEEQAAFHRADLAMLPTSMAARRADANATTDALPRRRLHAGFVEQALSRPQALAVAAPERSLSYQNLLDESLAVAAWLETQGVAPGEPVAVLMRKGWEQVVAVYGVLLAGAAYMPIDADLPVRRQAELLRIGEVAKVLTQPSIQLDDTVQAGRAVLPVRAGTHGRLREEYLAALSKDLDGLAYVIFTSGTTGVPKGVMIEHGAAANTVMHVNRLHGVGAEDRVLAVSSLSFDLSVYDIFGIHAAGGTLVMPAADRAHDPVHWLDLMAAHGVTFWNSAPQLMQMLMDCVDDLPAATAPLRCALLSGDFIPLDLPDRIRAWQPQARVVSLGGATEASIWSIAYPIERVDAGWASIPYGKPLPNQTLYVLDAALRACPDHVVGRIYIGGVGLARGYWRDDEKTAQRFVTHPATGERLYDTGDLGRYACDGNILILGRDDGQVKVRGHRVELGEIESVLRDVIGSRQCLVDLTPGERRQLVAYVELRDEETVDWSPVRSALAERLPDYMVPQHFLRVDQLPLSANGKVDRRALAELAQIELSALREVVPPRDALEESLQQAWMKVLPGEDISVVDNFFELGGDSIMAMQLLREVNAVVPGVPLQMHELFENPSIEMLATLLRNRTPDSAAPSRATTVDAAQLRRDADVFSAQVGRLAAATGRRQAVRTPAAVLVTGATGWIGSHVVAELLARTSAQVHCLVRARNPEQGRHRVVEALRRQGIAVSPGWEQRIVPLCGDLRDPRFGVGPAEWTRLAGCIDAVYHFAATDDVLLPYDAHRAINVEAVVDVLRLAAENRPKSVWACSPMTVCRRFDGRQVEIHHEEARQTRHDGLLTGYVQSKWVAEQLYAEAARHGIGATVFRTSHALPDSRTGHAKLHDTYTSVLAAVLEQGRVPCWADSAMHGAPVDVLARLIVEVSLADAGPRGPLIHVENRNPWSIEAIAGELLAADDGGIPARMTLDDWLQACAHATAGEPAAPTSGLAQALFADGPFGSPVRHMFHAHPIDTASFERAGWADRLSQLTPQAYWRQLSCSLKP